MHGSKDIITPNDIAAFADKVDAWAATLTDKEKALLGYVVDSAQGAGPTTLRTGAFGRALRAMLLEHLIPTAENMLRRITRTRAAGGIAYSSDAPAGVAYSSDAPAGVAYSSDAPAGVAYSSDAPQMPGAEK